MVITNIEIKARSSNNSEIRELLISKNAKFIGKDHQTDVYFNLNRGRFKLRKGNIEHSLIFYDREDKAEAKKSEVLLFKLIEEDGLEQLLTDSLGILVVVDKEREIYFIDNVKFHLDNVSGLGEFVEIEAIDSEGNIGTEELRKQCGFYKNLFGIRDEDLVAQSYSDLLLKK